MAADGKKMLHKILAIRTFLIRLPIHRRSYFLSPGVCRPPYRVVLVAVTCRATLIFTFFRCCSTALQSAIKTKQYFASTSRNSLLDLLPALLRVQAQARQHGARWMQAPMRNAVIAGAFARWQIGGETSKNGPNHLNGDVAEIAVFARRLSQVFY